MGAVVAQPIYDAAIELIAWLNMEAHATIKGAFLHYDAEEVAERHRFIDGKPQYMPFDRTLSMVEARWWDAELKYLDQKYGIEAMRGSMGVVAAVAREILEGRVVDVSEFTGSG